MTRSCQHVPKLTSFERQWCEQFAQGKRLQAHLEATYIAEPCDENPQWIEPYITKSAQDVFPITSESECEALWVLGLGQGIWLNAVLPWLQEPKERFLLVMETRASYLRAFLQSERAPFWCQHPKVAILFWDEKQDSSQENSLLQLAAQLLCDTRSRGLLHPSYADAHGYCLLQRMHQVIDDLQSIKRQNLLGPDVLAYALKNVPMLEGSRFHVRLGPWIDTPVVLCGAGPSIMQELDWLRRLQDRWLIISCGTASQVLQAAGIWPDWVAGVCSYPAHYDRFRRNNFYETPALTSLRVHPGVMRAMSTYKVLIRNLSGSASVRYLEGSFDNGPVTDFDYGTSVLTSAMKACVEMGARKIVLAGVDLCYLDDCKYGVGADHIKSPQLHTMPDVEYSWHLNQEGQQVLSNFAWLQERAWMERYLAKNSHVELVQVSRRSLPIQGAKHQTLEQLWQSWGSCQRDWTSCGWQAYQSAPEHHPVDAKLLLGQIWNSFERVRLMTQECLEELRLLARMPNQDAIQKILHNYLQGIRQEPTFDGFLLGIDTSMIAVQARQLWQLSRTPCLQQKFQDLQWLALVTDRISVMSQRVQQLQLVLEDVAWERDWLKPIS